jgi:hypothetical protein
MAIVGGGFVIRAARSLSALVSPRPLTPLEREFLEAEFDASLDLNPVRVAGGGHPLGRLAWQPTAALIQLSDHCFEQADPTRSVRSGALPVLAHEALHVWQRVHKQCAVNVSVDGLWLGVRHGAAAYRYDRSLQDPERVLQEFLKGNIEQQGQIFEDYVRSHVSDRRRRDTRFAAVARYVRNFSEGRA